MASVTVTLTQTVLRIDYEDPAGSCAGWFLHVVHSHGPIVNDPPTAFISSLKNDPDYSSGQLTGASERAIAFRKAIDERLDRMFWSSGRVKWTATLVEAVTPAVIDADF